MSASAQDASPAAGYEPLGVRAGSFIVLPSLTTSATYSDNIYRTQNNKEDDLILTVQPQVLVESTWSRHALNLHAGVQSRFYDSNSSEDHTNWRIGADGRLDITRDTNVVAEIEYAESHEERGQPLALALAAEPTPFSMLSGKVELNQRFNRMTGTLGASYLDIDFDNVPAFGGGIINSDDRDREIFGQRLRLGYDVSPDMNVFVEGRLNQVRYDLQPPAVPNSRDSEGYAVQGGVTFAITRLVSGEVAVGYLEQEYDSPAFPDVSGLAYNADISWSMTPLTTVTFGAGSSVDESTSVGVGGRLSQYARVGIDHELMRNVQLGGALRFQNDDFEGSPQNEDYFDAGIGVRYLMNRNVSLRLGYDYGARDSNVAGRDYTENRVGLSLTLQR
ncbi:outer membrane beta-barrel protein [Parvibaculum sp.]|uniref:outer membrane beta-barrel protein n=1 Tax=Parvibaculum sp. TaxID=2024848 RepID=UPI001DE93860|nr:outer membrane beta-barrel protein [Parvibaculum sp.]MBX3489222.1 outer membrane beta-barrel protein [Parvibaculum sp.]